MENVNFLDSFIVFLGWIGVYAPLILGGFGSIIGCSISGSAACGALLEADGGYGRFVGVAAMPSSQSIYGIVITVVISFMQVQDVTLNNSIPLFIIGFFTGVLFFLSAVKQGQCCAASINVSKSKPEIFGMSVAPAGIVEGFAVMAFAFAFVLIMQEIPAQ